MIAPSLRCPAGCAYCFGPHEGGSPMRHETLEAVGRWLGAGDGRDALDITFHGGEPLVPGTSFYRLALPSLCAGRPRVRFAIQSNLWLLTDELCTIFREYGVSIGTSLDGPEHVNDRQRGRGYFRRTMSGIDRARRHGLAVGCICTFTAQTAPHAEEVFDFFLREGLSFTIHAALPSLRYPEARGWTLSAEAYGELLIGMLDRYLANLGEIRIGTLDSLCRSISVGQGGICTFGDCLGDYLSIGPDGTIYPCQRFSGMPEYRLGNVRDCPSPKALAATPVWQAFEERQRRVAEECGDCPYVRICRGGCPYNALVANGGRFHPALRDPHCAAYRRVFAGITDRALEEVFSEENVGAIVAGAEPEAGLLRRGRLITLVRGGPHPYETAQQARRVLMAVALAATDSVDGAARKLEAAGVMLERERGSTALHALQSRLAAPTTGLNNLYLHVTFACPLRCTHCYARAGTERNGRLTVQEVVHAGREAAGLGFRRAVITGGEPLAHSERDALLDALDALRREAKPLLIVLRTSLALHLDSDLLYRIGQSADEVVVSLDGDRATHDARRGAGTYDLSVRNLRALIAMNSGTEVSLAAVLPAHLAAGAPGEAVRALAKDLGIRRTRFRPLLPLGRAIDSQPDLAPAGLRAHVPAHDFVAHGFSPVASCGIGQNIYVEPDGGVYPCYAWHGDHWLLGNVSGPGGLRAIVTSAGFQDLRRHTVNSNRQCRQCSLRYLCGGACRAWNRKGGHARGDLDEPPVDCTPLHARARSLLMDALNRLGISTERWLNAGLPLAESVPQTEQV
ncbi:MAG: TIGR04083 family peptide-modifying radical SAM enzyme [Chloroflexota bacterium]